MKDDYVRGLERAAELIHEATWIYKTDDGKSAWAAVKALEIRIGVEIRLARDQKATP